MQGGIVLTTGAVLRFLEERFMKRNRSPQESAACEFSPEQQIFKGLMEKCFRRWKVLGFTAAGSPDEFYGFHPEDIERAYLYKHGDGKGVWFRLHNGRVFDSLGHPDDPDPAWYEAVLH